MRPDHLDSLVVGPVGAEQRLDRQRAGHVRRLHQHRGVVHREGQQRLHRLGPVDQRQPLLRGQRQRLPRLLAPEPPPEPLPGITGSRSRASSSSSRAGSSARTPEYPAASVLARSRRIARTTSSSRGTPIPAACERTIAPCSVVRSASPTGVSASAPNPVFTPYTGPPPLSAFTTTERLVSISRGTSAPRRACAFPCATATTSPIVSGLPSTTTSRMTEASHARGPGVARTLP